MDEHRVFTYMDVQRLSVTDIKQNNNKTTCSPHPGYGSSTATASVHGNHHMLGAEEQTGSTYCTKAAAPTRRSVNMALNVHRNHKAY